MKAYKITEVLDNNDINVTRVLYLNDQSTFVVINKQNDRQIAISDQELTQMLISRISIHDALDEADENGLVEDQR